MIPAGIHDGGEDPLTVNQSEDSGAAGYGRNQAAQEAHRYWSAGQPPPLPKLGLERLLQELIGRSQEIIDTEQQLHRLLDAVVAVGPRPSTRRWGCSGRTAATWSSSSPSASPTTSGPRSVNRPGARAFSVS